MATSKASQLIQQLRRMLMQDAAGLTDGQLLGCFIEHRDEAAFAALIKRHGALVWGVCRRLLTHHDAEDAFQATFLVLCRKAASIRRRERVASWLYGVAHLTALQARRAAARRRGREKQIVDMPEPAVVEQDLWHDLQPLLDQELSRLPDIYRVVLLLCDLEGKTRKEVARQLDLPEGTVGSRLARARAMLAKRLARHGLAVSAGALAGVLAQEAAAAVPAVVMRSKIKAVTAVAAGQAAAGVVSGTVATLTEGVVKAMFLYKLKTAAAVALVLGALGGGALGVRRMAAAEPAPAEKPAATAAPGARAGPDDKKGTEQMKAKSLANAVKGFNDSAAGDPVGKGQPPLTPAEVIAAVRWSLLHKDKLPVSAETLKALGGVADTGELPPGWELEALTGYEPDDRVEFTVWSVRLRVPAVPDGSTCVPIRETWVGSRTIGEEERKVIQAWRQEQVPGSFRRAEWMRQYREERAKAAAVDRSKGQ